MGFVTLEQYRKKKLVDVITKIKIYIILVVRMKIIPRLRSVVNRFGYLKNKNG